MRKLNKCSAVVTLVAFALTGCSALRERPNVCKAVAGATGAALGGLGGGLGVSQVENGPDDGEIAGGAAAGFVAGGLLGVLAGHYICKAEEIPPPPPPAPPAKGTKIAEIMGPNFDFDKATLTAEGKQRVDNAAKVLKDNPSIKVSVDGHTDSIGSDKYNQGLSERRAQAVANELVSQGIAKSRLHVQGFGKRKPVADNKTAAGRARNRRVEIVVE